MTMPRWLVRRVDRRAADWLVPGAASLSLLVACIVVSGKKPLWYDEILTRMLLTDPSLSHMLDAMADGAESAPPLYHLIGRVWVTLFGGGALPLRMMSWLGFTIAIAVTWRVLRSAFGTRASAVGLLAVFCGSMTVLQQDAEVRFYGLLTALVATSAAVSLSVMQRERPSKALLVGSAAVNAALVLCHFFGFVYSGSLLAAQMAWDARQGRFRPIVYASVLLGWLAYTPWIGPTLSQAAMGKPHNWVPIPGIPDLLSAFAFQIPLLPLVILAILFLAALTVTPSEQATVGPPTLPVGGRRLSMLYVAFALIAVVPVVFLFSRITVSLFLDRYFLPAAIGWCIILADLATRAYETTRSPAVEAWPVRFGWGALLALLLVYPVYRAVSADRIPKPGSELNGITVAGKPVTALPIAVESALLFLPLIHYAPSDNSPYFFVVDWEAALDSHSSPSATIETKGMRVFRRQGFFAEHIVEGTTFLCEHPLFAVLDGAHYQWAERRVLNDSAFVSHVAGGFRTMHDTVTVRIAERRPGHTPVGCAPNAARTGQPSPLVLSGPAWPYTFSNDVGRTLHHAEMHAGEVLADYPKAKKLSSRKDRDNAR
jgi:hypothetical protein